MFYKFIDRLPLLALTGTAKLSTKAPASHDLAETDNKAGQMDQEQILGFRIFDKHQPAISSYMIGLCCFLHYPYDNGTIGRRIRWI